MRETSDLLLPTVKPTGEMTSVAGGETPLVLRAPLAGWVAPISEVPDPVFAQGLAGPGLAIDPLGDQVVAPFSGVVTLVAKTCHALTLTADEGPQVLIHVGIDTVALEGRGFELLVAEGDRIESGQPLLRFDLSVLAEKASALITPIVLVNAESYELLTASTGRIVGLGEPLVAIRRLSSQGAVQGDVTDPAQDLGAWASVSVVLQGAHGLHARPSALIAGAARTFLGPVEADLGEKTANAKSATALMRLEAHQNDHLVLRAKGPGAETILASLAQLITDWRDAPDAEPQTPQAPTPAAVLAEAASGFLPGVRAAPGFAVGEALVFKAPVVTIPETTGAVAEESERLLQALLGLDADLQIEVRHHRGPEAEILKAHLAILDDPELKKAALAAIAAGVNAGQGWAKAMAAEKAIFAQMADARMRARVADLEDLEQRVLAKLYGAPDLSFPKDRPVILVAKDVTPSIMTALKGSSVVGIALYEGGATSHAAIIAQSQGLPMIVALGQAAKGVQAGQTLILDAQKAQLETEASALRLTEARALEAILLAERTEALNNAKALAHTRDGVRIEVFSNLGGLADVEPALKSGAEGCGLLRTEFLFQDRLTPPSEDEQYADYRAIAEALGGRDLIIRTLDVGGDKPIAYLDLPREDNPALGLRGIRTSFWSEPLLRDQLRALIRVAAEFPVKIMLPMVVEKTEVQRVRDLLALYGQELGITAPVALGIMIETPASAVLAPGLIEVCDFFSVGTNDLTQYALAMDRGHAGLAARVDHAHPAVLNLIALAARAVNGGAGQAKGAFLGVCGGAAADLDMAPILIGLGVRELSATAAQIPALKSLIAKLDLKACQDLAVQTLGLGTAAEVRARAAAMNAAASLTPLKA